VNSESGGSKNSQHQIGILCFVNYPDCFIGKILAVQSKFFLMSIRLIEQSWLHQSMTAFL